MTEMPRILLFGLYELGFRSLAALAARGLRVVGVVSKPEATLEVQAFARLARAMGVPLFAPDTPRQARFLRAARELKPDLIAVSGYHRILPSELLDLPPRGVVNLHGSLLPAYRGPCPWKWAILNGETKTGVTIHRMSAELDRGEILTQAEVAIEPKDTGETLFQRLCAVGGPLLARTIEDLEAGLIVPRAQDERKSSYQGYPTDEDARICWEWTAERIANQVRAFHPRPGAWTKYGGRRVQIGSAAAAEGPLAQLPGMILGRMGESLIVSTGQGNLSVSGLTIDGGPRPTWTPGPSPGTFFDAAPAPESPLEAR